MMRLRKLLPLVGVPVLAGALGLSALPSGAATPYVSASPDSNLVDGQVIRVSGGGYSGGAPVGIAQCVKDSTAINECDGATSFSTNSDGTFSKNFTVQEVITVWRGNGAEEVDCSVPDSCEIVSVYIHGFAGKASAPLHFAS